MSPWSHGKYGTFQGSKGKQALETHSWDSCFSCLQPFLTFRAHGWEGAVSSHWIQVMTLGSDKTLLTPDHILQLRKERPGRMDTDDTRGGHRPHTIHVCKQHWVTMTLRSEQYYSSWQESEPHLGTSAPQGLSIGMLGGGPLQPAKVGTSVFK